MFGRHLKENAAVLILHPQEEFQLKAHLVLQAVLLKAIPRFRPSAKKGLTELISAGFSFRSQAFFRQFTGEQKGRHGHTAIHNVLAIVTRIVPAAVSIPQALALHTRVKSNRVVSVRHRTRPLSRKFGQKLYPTPLVVKRLDISK